MRIMIGGGGQIFDEQKVVLQASRFKSAGHAQPCFSTFGIVSSHFRQFRLVSCGNLHYIGQAPAWGSAVVWVISDPDKGLVRE
jgi:hypothetical protein